ncbi:hypothetical protein F9C11_17640 [Amycolatopsis sp. VS8301801F10]|uniref:hypothetical protein n=1 Tax=Amycolatopsis sp. VS8301801F10 TaxID=2652442 RepID=UPI0038FBF444
MGIFWWAIIILAVLSVLTLCVGLAVVIPVRNALRRQQERHGCRVDPGAAGDPVYSRQPPAPQQPLGQPRPPYPRQQPPTAPGRH